MIMNKFLRAYLPLILLCTAAPSGAVQDGVTLRPYVARYQVSYRGMSGGSLEFKLKRLSEGQYEFSSRPLPNFIGGLFISDEAQDTSVIEVNDGIRPLHFRSDDGTSRSEKDISQDFDWTNKVVKGRAKNEDFELKLPDNAQDRLSIQLAASLALRANRELGALVMVEGNSLKDYTITRQGAEHVRTPAGEYDTVVLNSERVGGSTRATRYWYAEQLGFLPVRAERTSKGKVDIVMELKSFQFL